MSFLRHRQGVIHALSPNNGNRGPRLWLKGAHFASGAGWSPLNLFAGGKLGAWYDPSDLTTMFQDSTGTTPVTADGQPVGLIRDKSGNGNHASQSVAEKRPIYKTSAGIHWLFFDGVDDSLYTASINLSATSKITVFAGTSNLKTASTGTLMETSANYLNNVGSFAFLTPSLATSQGSFGSHGSLAAGEKETQDLPTGNGTKRVITAAQDFATIGDYGCDYIRINQISIGNLVGAGNTSVGTGPLGNFPAYIGARNNGNNAAGGNSLWGNIYSLIFIGEVFDEATLVKTEKWIDAKITAVSTWSPAYLFAAGEQGAWYDPSDLTTMFQDRAGTTPVTADGQTVGLILDKRKGLVLGPELVTNGTFSGGVTTGWTAARSGALTVVGGGMQIANTANDFGSARQNFSVTTGAKYKISFDVVSTSLNASLWVGSSVEGTQSIDSGLLVAGSYSYIVSAAGSTLYIQALNAQATSGLLSVFDNISVKELAGNHATAPSDAARPLYKTNGTYHWLQFDGVDDSLSTAAVNFTATDKMSVWYSNLYALLPSTGGIVAVGSGLPGTVFAYLSASTETILARGSAGAALSTRYAFSALPAATKRVIFWGINLGASTAPDSLFVRKNTALLGTGDAIPGGGTFISTSLVIGKESGNVWYLNGNIYSMIVRGALSTTQEITDTETWVNGKTGAY